MSERKITELGNKRRVEAFNAATRAKNLRSRFDDCEDLIEHAVNLFGPDTKVRDAIYREMGDLEESMMEAHTEWIQAEVKAAEAAFAERLLWLNDHVGPVIPVLEGDNAIIDVTEYIEQ